MPMFFWVVASDWSLVLNLLISSVTSGGIVAGKKMSTV